MGESLQSVLKKHVAGSRPLLPPVLQILVPVLNCTHVCTPADFNGAPHRNEVTLIGMSIAGYLVLSACVDCTKIGHSENSEVVFPLLPDSALMFF